MVDIAKLVRLFSLLCLIGSVVMQSSVTDRMPDPTVALKSAYNEGLKNLKNLFHIVLNYEENVNGQNASTEDIQKSIKQAGDSIMKIERITAFHSELNHLHLLSVTREITLKENRLRNETAEQNRLTMEHSEWEDKAVNLRREIADIEIQVHNSNDLIKFTEDKLIKRRHSLKRVNPGAISNVLINDKDLQRIRSERAAQLDAISERRQLLKIAESNLNKIANQLLDIEQSVKNNQSSLASARSKQEQIRTIYLVLRDLGIQVRNIGTFLAKFYDKLRLVSDQQEVVKMLQPLSELIQILSRKPRQNKHQIP